MAKKTKTTSKTSASELAERMASLKEDIATREAVYKAYAAQLLAILKEEHRDREGIFKIAKKRTLKIIDMGKAMAWGSEHNALKLDTTKATEIMRRELMLPEGFSVEESEYLTSAGRKEKTEN